MGGTLDADGWRRLDPSPDSRGRSVDKPGLLGTYGDDPEPPRLLTGDSAGFTTQYRPGIFRGVSEQPRWPPGEHRPRRPLLLSSRSLLSMMLWLLLLLFLSFMMLLLLLFAVAAAVHVVASLFLLLLPLLLSLLLLLSLTRSCCCCCSCCYCCCR